MDQLISLFFTFMLIGVSAFGGGYAVMPLIQKYIVESHGWINLTELADITSISQMTPGPIFINAATFVGIKVSGQMGGIVATMGSVIPSFCLVLILGYLFNKHGNLYFVQNIMKGLRPTIVGLIWVAAITLVLSSLFTPVKGGWIDLPSAVAFLIALLLSLKTKWDTLLIVLAGALVGLASYFIRF